MQTRTAHEKQWQTIRRTKKETKGIVNQIVDIVGDLSKRRKYIEFASEHHLAAYLYHRLIGNLPIRWDIMVEPTMSTVKKRYKDEAKNIPPYFKPDIVIYLKETKREEEKHPKSKSAKVRFDCDRKNSIAIELSLQRPEITDKYEDRLMGIDLKKIYDDRQKYKRERFQFHCIYVNQHPKTILTHEKYDQFLKLCDEKWFHYAGEDIRDKTSQA